MKNLSLVSDYLKRAEDRLDAVDLLHRKKSWANVVRESQEIVELCLKAYLRDINIEVPRIHDVSGTLQDNKGLLTGEVSKNLKKIIMISKSLRRDREIAFYGTEDLTPSEFYSEEDADQACEYAKFIFNTVLRSVKSE
ncbi:MAG TPA: HEPN domain-containing protein [Oligoflexia bacterium]|nr:HEPN domain-containing protein [Oligoflexia bacterium]HMP48625.1 HEPN domain-containing protein [Oligoflexia bacterium]